MTEKDEGMEIDLDAAGEIEIEIEDDTPPEDQGRAKPEAQETPAADDGEDDLAGYSAGVQKRINKLKYDFHEERRRKEEAERLREEAIRFAEHKHREAEALRQRITVGEGAAAEQAQARITSEIERAKKDFKDAYEAGESDAMLDAQDRLTKLRNEEFQLAARAQQQEQRAQQAQQPAPRAPQPTPRAQVAEPPQRAKEWAAQNDWFMKDTEMTGYAMGVHERLVNTGVDPNSETYYTAIDEAMRSRFADKLGAGVSEKAPSRQAGSVVAPAGRSPKSPRKITLSASQVALAKRIGVSPEEYAAQILELRKQEKANG